MEIKILQVFYDKNGLPYKDKERTVHYPITSGTFLGASNTTQIRFYYDQLDELNESTFVAVSKLPNGKIGSEILESEYDSELQENYAVLNLSSFYTQYKGDVYISLQGYQGGVKVEQDENGIYSIIGTPTIQATGSIKLSIAYAPTFIGSGQTENITLQRVLAELSTKLGIRQETLHVEELPTVGNPNIWYVVKDDANDPSKANIYIWNAKTQSYVWVGDNTLDLGAYYTQEQGEQFESDIDNRVTSVENELSSVAQGSPKGVYATLAALQAAYPTGADGIYVVQADGHWYYWNSSSWTDGGVYLQSAFDMALDEDSTNAPQNAIVSKAISKVLKEKCGTAIISGKSDLPTLGFVNSDAGRVVFYNDFEGYHYKEITNIKPYYDFFGLSAWGALCGLIFADSDNNVLLDSKTGFDVIVTIDGSIDLVHKIVKTPPQTSKIYVSYRDSWNNEPQLMEFSDFEFEEKVISPKECQFFNKTNKNMLDMSSCTPGVYWSDVNVLSTINSNQWVKSSIMEIPKGAEKLTLSLNGRRSRFSYVQFYDYNKVAIFYKNFWGDNVSTIDVPDNAKYIDIEIINLDEDYDPTHTYYYQLEVGENPSIYEPFSSQNIYKIDGEYIEYGNARWKNKKWVVVGDSLTEVNSRTTKHYFDYVAEKTGISVVNMGVSGTGYARGYNETNAFYQRVQNIPLDADVITIFGSGNDLGSGLLLGDPGDTGTDTICGCINTTLDNILNRYLTNGKLPTIGVITPTPWIGSEPSNPDNLFSRYCNAIIECCKRKSIPVLDLYRESNLHPDNATFRQLAYSRDDGGGVHPDENGHKIIAPMFEAFLYKLLLS